MRKLKQIYGGDIHIMKIAGDMQRPIKSIDQGGIIVGENDYEKLDNKPSIEAVTLIGDKSFHDLGLDNITNIELYELLK